MGTTPLRPGWSPTVAGGPRDGNPAVHDLRLRFGLEVQHRLGEALGPEADRKVLDTLLLWARGLLQGGMVG